MCKIFTVIGINEKNREKVEKLVKAATPIMSESPDNDGFGYAVINAKGEVGGEKWLDPKTAWKSPKKVSDSPVFLTENFGEALEKDVVTDEKDKYVELGQGREEPPLAIIMHARNRTTADINIKNTHPFILFEGDDVIHDTALIHNGTIRNHDKLNKKVLSDCDSEVILHQYLEKNIHYVPASIEEVAAKLIGEYAVCALTSIHSGENGEVTPIVDIFKSNKELYCTHVEDLGILIFATTKEIIEKASKVAEIDVTSPMKVKDCYLIRVNAKTCERMELLPFKKSDLYIASTYTGHNYNHNSHHHDYLDRYKSRGKYGETVLDMKRKFQEDHLKDPYYAADELSAEDQAILARLDEEGDERERALVLVQEAIRRKGA